MHKGVFIAGSETGEEGGERARGETFKEEPDYASDP